MGGDSKQSMTDYAFDLEEDLKDVAKLRAMEEKIRTRIQDLKKNLRSGGDKQTFDQVQTVLHGYEAMQRVIERTNRKMA